MRLDPPPRVVADHQRDPAGAQELVPLGHEPALVPELEAMAPGRQLRDRVREPLVVAPEVARQLPQDRPHLRRAHQRLDSVVERLDARAQVLEPLDVRDVAAHLHREQESRRADLYPVRYHFAARPPVEGRVHLDRVEMPRVVVEPLARRAARWIEDAVPPVVVVPPGAADSNRSQLFSAAKSFWHSSGVPAATTRERPSTSSGAASNGGASGRSITSPHSRTSSCAAAMSTERAPFSEHTASTRPAARWQREIASEPMIRNR